MELLVHLMPLSLFFFTSSNGPELRMERKTVVLQEWMGLCSRALSTSSIIV
jgi:hypothetical protein